MLKYECLHIVNICNKSPTNKTKKNSKGLTISWKDYFKHCSIGHKTILACFIISNVVLGFMIIIKYPFIGILNIEWGENMVKYIEKIVISKTIKKWSNFWQK